MENHQNFNHSEEKDKEFDIEIDEEIDEDSLKFITVDGEFKNNKVILSNSATSQSLYEKNYFGTLLQDNSLELEILEALLLIERSRIIIFDENKKEMSAEQILSRTVKEDPRIWIKYLVYRDLRQRGYIVRLGYGQGIDFRVYPRGSTRAEAVAKFFIYILDEGNSIQLQNLSLMTEQTLNARKKLIIVTIDRLGDPTYYHLEQSKLPENSKKENFW